MPAPENGVAVKNVSAALGLLSSVIKSGEVWSADCQTALDNAEAEILAAADKRRNSLGNGPKRQFVGLRKNYKFSAAHHLPLHMGKCRDVHGHTYTVGITIFGDASKLGMDGLLLDFATLDGAYYEVIHSRYDHKDLNQFFDHPSAEILVRSFYNALMAHFEALNVPIAVASVTLREGEGGESEFPFAPPPVGFEEVRMLVPAIPSLPNL